MAEIECPGCGCNLCHEMPGGAWWGKATSKRYRCDECATEFNATAADEGRSEIPNVSDDDEDAVVYHILSCRKCGSTRVPVTKSKKPIRYHKCAACGYTFRSVERLIS